jgi:hypothetical protein
MTNEEILEVLYLMRRNWTIAINNKDNIQNYVPTKFGFCHLIFDYVKKDNFKLKIILKELKKDILINIPAIGFWYPTYYRLGASALQIRLDHLNRTIARLELQKTQQNG